MNNLHEMNRRLIAAISAADGAYYRWARSTGVTQHTLDLLYALDDGLPHFQKQICEEWLIPKTTINTVVKTCRDAGWVTLSPMPGHPRQQQLRLTAKGHVYARQVLEELHTAENAAMAETAARFGPDFVDAMEFFAVRFQAAIDAALSGQEDNSV